MDSGKHLFKALLGKKPESQLSQEDGQPSATPSPAVAWGQPSAQSSSQQVLQTQDWVSWRKLWPPCPWAPLWEPWALALEVWVEQELYKLGEGPVAPARKQVLSWGPYRMSVFSSPEP